MSAGADDLCGMGARQPRLRGVPARTCRPGDRVAIMLPNMLAYPVTFLGTLRAGLIVVNVNPLYTPRELKRSLRIAAPRHRDHGEFCPQAGKIIADTEIRHVVVARLGDFVPMLKRWAFNFANSLYPARRAGVALRRFHHAAGRMQPRSGEALRRRAHAGRTWRCCNIPAARPACRKARCCRTAI